MSSRGSRSLSNRAVRVRKELTATAASLKDQRIKERMLGSWIRLQASDRP